MVCQRAPKLAVPAYFGPWEAEAWERLLADRPDMIVFNPASGVGDQPMVGYLPLLERARQNGTAVLGYVSTSYLSRPLDHGVAEAQRYSDWYRVDGIFWDEIPAESERGRIGQLRVLRDAAFRCAADSSRARCVFNPGRAIPTSWFAALPGTIWVTSEAVATAAADRPVTIGPKHRQWVLVHDCAPKLRAELRSAAASSGIGWFYAAEKSMPNPWDDYHPH